MPLHGHIHRRSTLDSGPPSGDETKSDTAAGAEEETIVEPEQGNVLSHIIAQLRPGADLSRVTLPTFLLEPRSMLERITNFMAHPDTLLPVPEPDDQVKRFIAVVKFYLSGWHIKDPGVKKPLNPILGETFTGFWDYGQHTRGYYIAEQTSHHPPKSSYFFMAPHHGLRVDGTLKPRSKFLGNSAASMMEGISYLRLLNRGRCAGGEKYILTQPNMYARGILFGKMKYELGDHSYVRCPENDLVADIEFKVKGYFSGTYNAIGGQIRNEKTGQVLYELSGLWSGEMFIRDLVTGHKELLFDATHAQHVPPKTRPLDEQSERESQRLWRETVLAVHARDHDRATLAKSAIEDQQRAEAAKRAQEDLDWRPILFRRVRAGPGQSEEGEGDLDWIINAHIDGGDADRMTDQILAIAPILPGQKAKSGLEIPGWSSQSQKNEGESLTTDDGDSAAASTTATVNGTSEGDLIDLASPPQSTTPAERPARPTDQSRSDPRSHSLSQGRTRSVSLLDTDRLSRQNSAASAVRAGSGASVGAHSHAVPAAIAAATATRHPADQPIKRLDTTTKEEEHFFDAPT